MRTRALIFDMDGTLTDSIPTHVEAYRRVLEKNGLPPDTGFIASRFGMVSWEIWEAFAAHYKLDLDPKELARQKFDLFLELADNITLLPGVIRVLDHADYMGWKTAIATGANRDNMETALRTTGIRDRFDFLLPGDEAPRGKAHPDIWLAVARALRVDPSDCTVFEDGVPGLLSARDAKMRTVAVASGFLTREELATTAPDLLIDSLDDLDLKWL